MFDSVALKQFIILKGVSVKDPTAYLILTGNEILTGKMQDTNGKLVIKKAPELGLRLIGITILPDDVERIAFSIKRAKQDLNPTFIFTSGGIGPSHDDVTMAGVAKGLDRELIRNKELEDNLRQLYCERFNESVLKMADVPEDSILIWAGKLVFPIIKTENVYSFPGGPQLFAEKFKAISNRFVGGEEYVQVKFNINLEETELTTVLNKYNIEYKDLMVGSYPQYDEDRWWTVVTFDGRGRRALEEIVEKFKDEFSDPKLIEKIEFYYA